MKLPFRATVNFALGGGLILIGLSIAASYVTINSLIRGAQQETKTQETVSLLDGVVSQFKTVESLQQRYLLTNTAKDLAAYQQARARIQQALLGVRGAPAFTNGREDLRTLDGLIVRRMALMEQTAAARQQSGPEAAAALVGSELNRQLHEDIDSLVTGIKSAETSTLERSREETRQTAQTVKLLILLGGLVSLSVLAWAVLMIIRSQGNRRRIQAQLADSEAMSRAVTESMVEGVVTATPDGVICVSCARGRRG